MELLLLCFHIHCVCWASDSMTNRIHRQREYSTKSISLFHSELLLAFSMRVFDFKIIWSVLWLWLWGWKKWRIKKSFWTATDVFGQGMWKNIANNECKVTLVAKSNHISIHGCEKTFEMYLFYYRNESSYFSSWEWNTDSNLNILFTCGRKKWIYLQNHSAVLKLEILCIIDIVF